MTSIITEITDEAEKLLSEAGIVLKKIAVSITQEAVALVKETSLGTDIMNLISAAASTSYSGVRKFENVIAAAEKGYADFVSGGGLAGLELAGINILRQLVQSLYDDFVAAGKAIGL